MNTRTPDDFPAPDDIVIFQPEFVEFGGEERVILALSEGLHAQGKPHSVLCYHDKIDLARHARLPLRVHQLRPSAAPRDRVRSLRDALTRLEQQGSPVPVLFSIQSGLHAGLGGARRYHLRIPDTYRLLTPAPLRGPLDPRRLGLLVRHWATRRGVQRAQSLVTNTRVLADEMHSLYGRMAHVVYLGGQGDPSPQAPGRPASPIELLSVSRLQASKRIDWMLRALAALKDDPALPDWRLHVAGTGPEKESLPALSQALGLGERVVFHGFVSDAQLADLYRRSHVFLMPALQGYGLPAIEALYRHSAVVMNVESGVCEVLRDTPWVSIAEPGEAAFQAALREMLLRVGRPGFFSQPMPALPTMQTWAGELIGRLGW